MEKLSGLRSKLHAYSSLALELNELKRHETANGRAVVGRSVSHWSLASSSSVTCLSLASLLLVPCYSVRQSLSVHREHEDDFRRSKKIKNKKMKFYFKMHLEPKIKIKSMPTFLFSRLSLADAHKVKTECLASRSVFRSFRNLNIFS